jgi:hypothetical protein
MSFVSSEKINKDFDFVYNPVTGKWVPTQKVQGTPTYLYRSGVTSATQLLTLSAGQYFGMTDLLLTNTGSAAVTVTVADGSTTILTYNVPASGSVDIQFQTPIVFAASVTVSATAAANVTVNGLLFQ